jgi:predicted TPR repeat methyltransferase
MASDTFQIALEHHRAGRVRQAADIYRSLIDANPQHADAMHWLGVLAFQAGRPAQAIPFLEGAFKLCPMDAAFAHNLGLACLHAGQFAQAVQALDRATEMAPDRAETLLAWGLARLAQGEAEDLYAAVVAFRQARFVGLDTAQLHQYLGMAHLGAGEFDDAMDAFVTAVERDPHDPAAWHILALAHRHQRNAKEVRKCLNKALEIDPLRATAWCALGALDTEEGNYDIAAALFRKAIKADPTYATAHHALGRALELAGRREESIDAFARAIHASRTPAKSPLAASRAATADIPLPEALNALEEKLTSPKAIALHHALAANADIFSPTQVPNSALANLFDKYAETFDNHLQGQLQYRVPEIIVQTIAALAPGDKPLDILDLGCGTGLCGPLLKPMAATLAGVDLSPNMIEKAKARSVYDRLGVGELVATLNDNPNAFDLLVAADVLIYIGDFSPVFEAARKALRPGGFFAFSVEGGGGDRYHLQRKTLRYTHSQTYLKRLAKIHGLMEVSFKTVTLRVENDKPVAGYIVVLRSLG